MKRAVRGELGHQGERDVMDGDAAFGFAGLTAVMGVAVEHPVERVAIERFFEAAAAEEGIDLERFALDGSGDGGVMQQRVAALGAKA